MGEDFLEDLRQGGCGFPVPGLVREDGVEDGPRNVEGAAGLVAGNLIGVVDGQGGADFFRAPC